MKLINTIKEVKLSSVVSSFKLWKSMRLFFSIWTLMSFILAMAFEHGIDSDIVAILFNAMTLFTFSFFIKIKTGRLLFTSQLGLLGIVILVLPNFSIICIIMSGILPILLCEAWLFFDHYNFWFIGCATIVILFIGTTAITNNLFLGFIILEAFLFSVLTFILLLKSQYRQIDIIRKMDEANHSLRKMEIKNRLLAKDAERKRIMEDLHDGMLQELIGLRLTLEVMVKEFDHMTIDEIKIRMMNLLLASKSAIQSSRSALLDLDKKIVDESFNSQLEKLIVEFKEHYGLLIKVDKMSDLVTVNKENTYQLIRVISEVLMNVVKHSESKVVVITQTTKQFKISDFGIGFDTNKENIGHFGLKNIHRKVSSIGWGIEIDSEINQGTTVILNYRGEMDEVTNY